jgi:hypothetical protein
MNTWVLIAIATYMNTGRDLRITLDEDLSMKECQTLAKEAEDQKGKEEFLRTYKLSRLVFVCESPRANYKEDV